MSNEETASQLSLPASLLLAHPPKFPFHDANGVSLEIDSLDPRIDPVIVVAPRHAGSLLRWGERHAAAILTDERIALWERQFFLQRGLTMQAARLFQYRARFKRLGSMIPVLQTVAHFLAAEPSSFAAALSMRPHAYHPASHAVSTGLIAAGLIARSAPAGSTKPEALMAPLLAGMVADIGLVDSHRNLLSFERAMTPPERNILRAHPRSSSRILQHLGITTERLLTAVEFHHERIDGSGYPLGLGGDALPPLAQCVGLADTFMTLISERPKSGSVDPAQALELLRMGQFDPQLVSELDALFSLRDAAQPAEVAA